MDLGSSRTWPMQKSTSHPVGKNFLMVCALVADSTIKSFAPSVTSVVSVPEPRDRLRPFRAPPVSLTTGAARLA
eukprot:42447-Eustigmatos_ZCMA.PRE.1